MSLEAKMDALIGAVEKLTETMKAAAGATKPAATTEKPATGGKAKPAAKVPTAEEVKAAVVAYAKRHDKAAAKALLKKVADAPDAASVAEDKRQAVIDACSAEPEESEDEDDI